MKDYMDQLQKCFIPKLRGNISDLMQKKTIELHNLIKAYISVKHPEQIIV